jgi:acetamidase/formamidase
VTKNRRQFIVQSPLGIVGALAAGSAWSRRASAQPITASAAAGGTASSPAASSPAADLAAGRPVLRWVPKHDELVYTFGGAPPRRRIRPGTRVITWTEDCFDGSLKTAADLMSKVTVPGHDNPQTGPFFVEGAEPGDTLAVHILSLEPARSYAISAFSPGFGALVGNDQTAMLGPELKETTWRYDVDAARKVARSTSGDGKLAWEVPLAPFLGCLGVAPADGEVLSTLVPGNFGGNMDCAEVRAGNTVYLNVNVPGGLISFGDGHYAMGDGEIMGGAIEGAMNVDLVIDLIKGIKTPIPRIENEREVMFVGCGRPLEDAARVAYKAMIGWIRDTSGLSELDAYQFLSQNAEASIIQMVDPQYTVLVKLAKMRMPSKA